VFLHLFQSYHISVSIVAATTNYGNNQQHKNYDEKNTSCPIDNNGFEFVLMSLIRVVADVLTEVIGDISKNIELLVYVFQLYTQRQKLLCGKIINLRR
jgi:hypothetical protein